jgi:arabinofuranosyltransferase
VFKNSFTPTLANKVITVLAILYAWLNKFIQDDAFISFRYAKNFVEGNGLRWNIGEIGVEGYSNFLWTIIISIGLKLEIEPVLFSQIIGIIFFILSLLIVYKIAGRVFTGWNSTLFLFLTSFNYSFSIYATGGLETSTQTFFCLYIFWLSIEYINNQKLATLFLYSLISGVSLLNRLDSGLFILVTGVFILINIINEFKISSNGIKRYLALFLPACFIVFTWLIWKWDYYGNILPNTFYVKGGIEKPLEVLFNGFMFVLMFLLYTFMLPSLHILVRTIFKESKEVINNIWQPSLTGLASIIILLWLVYILKIGGGFMEFRFLVPIIPFLYLLVIKGLEGLSDKSRKVFLGLLFLGLLTHPLLFGKIKGLRFGVESAAKLESHLYKEKWISVGKTLGDYFDSTNTKIAVTAAGAIPYYAQLYTVDMLGLNDKYIAKNGIIFDTRPGHSKISDINYLIDSKVNLLIGHPKIINDPEDYLAGANVLSPSKKLTPEEFLLISNKKLILIPLKEEVQQYLSVLYLTLNSEIDNTIEKNGWKTYEISPDDYETLFDM